MADYMVEVGFEDNKIEEKGKLIIKAILLTVS